MINLVTILICMIIGFFIIVYGFTRGEEKPNLFDNILSENIIVSNEKAFIRVTKINFVMLGFTVMAMGFLFNSRILNGKGFSLCVFIFAVIQSTTLLFIRFKCCKKI